MTNATVIVSACGDQCFYKLLLCIKIMVAQDRSIAPGGFTAAVLIEYRKLYRTKKELNDKETNKIVSKPDCFTEKTGFSKWYRHLKNFAGLLISEAGSPVTYIMRKDLTPFTGADITALLTLHEPEVMGTHHTGPSYESDSGTLWSLVCDLTEYRPAWARISKFKTSCDGRSTILALNKHYKGYAHKNEKSTTAYNMIKRSTYDRDCAHQTFEMFANRHITQYDILKKKKEEIPQHKQIHGF